MFPRKSAIYFRFSVAVNRLSPCFGSNRTFRVRAAVLMYLVFLVVVHGRSLQADEYVTTAAEAGISSQFDGPQAVVPGIDFNTARLKASITRRLEAALRGGLVPEDLIATRQNRSKIKQPNTWLRAF